MPSLPVPLFRIFFKIKTNAIFLRAPSRVFAANSFSLKSFFSRSPITMDLRKNGTARLLRYRSPVSITISREASKTARPLEYIPQPPCTIPRLPRNCVRHPGNSPRGLNTIARHKKSIPQPPCTIPRLPCNCVRHPGNSPRGLSTIARHKKSIPQPPYTIPRHPCNGVRHPGNSPRGLNTIARHKKSIPQPPCTIPGVCAMVV